MFIRATVSNSATQNISNTARVTSPTGNNDKKVTIITHLKKADIGINKTVNNPSPNYLDFLNYTITTTNYGPDSATGVQITDLLPTGIHFYKYNSTQGTYNYKTGIWDIGTLQKNQKVTLQINARVNKTGIITNTATKTRENEYDPYPANDKSSVKINVPSSAALDINKTSSNKKPRINDIVYFTYIINNIGPDTAMKVYVKDVLPEGLTYVSSTTNYGKYDPVKGIWTIGSIPIGSTAKMVIKSIVTHIGDITNKAKVYSITYDPITPNPEAQVTITVEPKPVPPTPQPHGKTVPMQNTGPPLVVLAMGLISIMAVVGYNLKK